MVQAAVSVVMDKVELVDNAAAGSEEHPTAELQHQLQGICTVRTKHRLFLDQSQ